MGKQLLKFYDIAKEKGGVEARMRLAMLSGIPPNRAAEIEDTEELISRFEKILSTIIKGKAL
ncbi:MAG: hypothetical protein JXB26_12830 [Candidatus Aminicenantes bacterium]|nr:hypothetical protein [Candidatus Aminicenantes bacterium]